jgi:hypothetical protein
MPACDLLSYIQHLLFLCILIFKRMQLQSTAHPGIAYINLKPAPCRASPMPRLTYLLFVYLTGVHTVIPGTPLKSSSFVAICCNPWDFITETCNASRVINLYSLQIFITDLKSFGASRIVIFNDKILSRAAQHFVKSRILSGFFFRNCTVVNSFQKIFAILKMFLFKSNKKKYISIDVRICLFRNI